MSIFSGSSYLAMKNRFSDHGMVLANDWAKSA